MAVSIEITKKAEDLLRTAFGEDLRRTALEAMAMEGYRMGKLSSHEVKTLLGFTDRWETQAWLASKGLHLNYTLEDLEADRKTLDRVLGPAKK